MTPSNKRFLIIGLALILVTALASPASAGQHFRMENTTDAYQMAGQTMPAKTDTTDYWIADGNVRVDMGDSATFVYVGSTKTLYGLNHTDKSYFEFAEGGFSKLLEREMGANSGPMMDQMMQMFHVKATVTPTEETKKIGDWNCTKYVSEVELMGTVVPTIMWATTDIDVDPALYGIATNAMKAILPGFDEMMTEFQKVKGIAVETSSDANFNGIQISTHGRLVDFSEADAPKDAFVIPEGYNKTEMQMPGMGGGMGGGR